MRVIGHFRRRGRLERGEEEREHGAALLSLFLERSPAGRQMSVNSDACPLGEAPRQAERVPLTVPEQPGRRREPWGG